VHVFTIIIKKIAPINMLDLADKYFTAQSSWQNTKNVMAIFQKTDNGVDDRYAITQKRYTMKPDVLTITTIIFIVGVLISSLGITEELDSEEPSTPPSALQQGITVN